MQTLVTAAQALGFRLTPEQARLFQIYSDELVDWNRRLSLTTIVDPQDIQVKHFLDSLTCLSALPAGFRCSTVLDVGSGAGFPGLPIKIYDPSLQVTLLESVAKKAAFLEHVVTALGLTGVTVVTDRAEALGQNPDHRQRYDLVAARAVADLAVLAEYCLPFCRVGGYFVAQKKWGIDAELHNATGAVATLGGGPARQVAVHLPGLEQRQLIVVEKVRPTPPRYPRRPGLPAKRPLV